MRYANLNWGGSRRLGFRELQLVVVREALDRHVAGFVLQFGLWGRLGLPL